MIVVFFCFKISFLLYCICLLIYKNFYFKWWWVDVGMSVSFG